MLTMTHVRDPLLSVWQSSVDKVLADTPGRAGAEDPLMIASNAVVQAVANRMTPDAANVAPAQSLTDALASIGKPEVAQALSTVAPAGRSATVFSGAAAVPLDCAKTALQIAHATLIGDTAKAKALEELMKFGNCNPMWAECITEFLSNAAIPGQTKIPYIPWNTLSDFVLPIADNVTIAIVGDWGTGGSRAAALLQNIAAQKPDIFIHLGDIYFSGTDYETQNYFKAVVDNILPPSIRRFTMPGNHDMYSGGKPYYNLIGQIGQPASFFCLQNTNWQIQAMDTAYNDFNPLNVNTVVTSVQDREMQWHADKLQQAVAQNRKTVLLSHHQLFSATEGFEGTPINHKLLSQFSSYFPGVAAWIWGHEHSHIIYQDGYVLLPKGRCIGASAMPIPTNDPTTQEPLTAPIPR